MKRQTSTINIQGSVNQQGSKARDQALPVMEYPEPTPLGSILNDGANGGSNGTHPFDLEERTAAFGEAIVRFSRKIPRDPTNNRLIDQLVGCGTSIGANYREASESISKKDFRCSICRCVKEAKETKYFLRMVAASESALVEQARELYREGNELHMIFASIFRNTKQ
jgi:four helix bundle protein